MTLVGDWHVLFPRWQGYGLFTAGAKEFLAVNVGRIDRVVSKTCREDDQIDFEVSVSDPDCRGGYETDDDLRCIWSCTVTFKKGDSHPTPHTIAAARDQQHIADGCAELTALASPASKTP